MNIGHSSLLPYDECAYKDKLKKSTDPLIYNLDTNKIWSCNQGLSTLGPRSGIMGNGVSTIAGHPVATAQYLSDVESILTNRNVPTSKCRNAQLNPINVASVPKESLVHLNNVSHYLDPISSRLTHPAFNYKEAPISRFYNLNQNPQLPVFWSFAVNTKNEAIDNFKFSFDKNQQYDPTLPIEFK